MEAGEERKRRGRLPTPWRPKEAPCAGHRTIRAAEKAPRSYTSRQATSKHRLLAVPCVGVRERRGNSASDLWSVSFLTDLGETRPRRAAFDAERGVQRSGSSSHSS